MNFIAWLQTRLAEHGFNPGKIDGIDGAKTRAALRAFESAKGFPVDGTADAAVIDALRADVIDSATPGKIVLSTRDAQMLNGVHPDLAKVYRHFIANNANFQFEVRITCGVRTLREQADAVARGASKTMKSRHLPSSNKSRMSEAIDLAAFIDGKPQWDWPLYSRMAAGMKASAKAVGVNIVWGGDWRSLKDGPHFELLRKDYPA